MAFKHRIGQLVIFFLFLPAFADRPADPPEAVVEPLGGVVIEDLKAGEDERKRFFLITPQPPMQQPANGFKLLLILPGGDGSADFQPFVQRIAINAVPPDFIIAQLVAPQWSPEQAKHFVWPTKATMLPEVKFSTQDFIDAVIDDVMRRHTINPDVILAMAWSSSGQAAYAATLDENSRVAGALVAMSVFKPEQLPDLANAKGKSYYILHSPQDPIPMRFPEAARDQLEKHGGTTKLVTYEGGHAWVGDVYGMIRAGVQWLERESLNDRDSDAAE